MKHIVHLLLTLCMLIGFVRPAVAQEVVIRGGTSVTMRISGIPAEEVAAVSGILTVSTDGKIKITYLETPLTAAGLTPSQLQRRIEEAYKAAEIFTEPTVSISADVTANGTATAVVSVGGEVRGPRDVPYRPGMTIFSAINSAGGPTEYSDMKRVKLIRNRQEKVLDLRKVNPETNIEIKEGDEIYVPQG